MDALKRLLFPDSPRDLPGARAWNIGFRTVHIGVTGILFGGHVFDTSEERLRIWLYLSIATGAALIFLEAYPSLRWLYQGRGVFVLTKLALLCAIIPLWQFRVYLLVMVLVIASVGSHMPGRFRYYSVIPRRMLND